MTIPFLAEQFERVFHHPDRPFDDLEARRDDGRRLLALEHRLRDLRRVREMTDTRLDHFDARFGEAVFDRLLERLGNFGRVRRERLFVVGVRIVRIDCATARTADSLCTATYF